MIQLINLQKKYNLKTVVNIDNLHISQGELFGLVGNNGAGKTTLFRLMLDLIKSEAGQCYIDNYLTSKNENWKDFTASYIDEDFLIDYLTPEEYFCFIGELYKVSNKDVLEKLKLFSAFFNGEILNQNGKLIRNFSKGNKQKIGIASCFISEPRLVILDEPFNSLDPSSQIILKQLIKNFNTNKQITFVISSHDLNHVTQLCTRIAILEKGVIKKDLTTNSETITDLTNYFSI